TDPPPWPLERPSLRPPPDSSLLWSSRRSGRACARGRAFVRSAHRWCLQFLQEFGYDRGLAVGVGLPVVLVLVGKSQLHDLVPLSRRGRTAEQVSEAPVVPPLRAVVVNGVQVCTS